jgi:hypothetical protein
MPIYRTEGTLTGFIQTKNIGLAQDYLTQDNMTKYLDEPLQGVVEHIQWHLHGDGHKYYVEAFVNRELTDDELKQLADWTSGQNSDGLGEGFEQQEFAEDEGDEDADCYNCDGSGQVETASVQSGEESEVEDCPTCDGAGYFEAEHGGMISFDWKTNKSTFTRVV